MIFLDYSCTGCLGFELRSLALYSRTHPQMQRLFCKIQIKTHFGCLGFETGSSGMINQNTSLDPETLYKINSNNPFRFYGIWNWDLMHYNPEHIHKPTNISQRIMNKTNVFTKFSEYKFTNTTTNAKTNTVLWLVEINLSHVFVVIQYKSNFVLFL